eukprot:scaffold10250_cov145-Amphora_coffeaeformis.AAC.1
MLTSKRFIILILLTYGLLWVARKAATPADDYGDEGRKNAVGATELTLHGEAGQSVVDNKAEGTALVMTSKHMAPPDGSEEAEDPVDVDVMNGTVVSDQRHLQNVVTDYTLCDFEPGHENKFNICVIFVDKGEDLPDTVKQAIRKAAMFWEQALPDDIGDMKFDKRRLKPFRTHCKLSKKIRTMLVDDIVICVDARNIKEPDALAAAKIRYYRGGFARLSTVTYNTRYKGGLQNENPLLLEKVAMHELAHALGFTRGLMDKRGFFQYEGPYGVREFSRMTGCKPRDGDRYYPPMRDKDDLTRERGFWKKFKGIIGSHWDADCLGSELMNPFTSSVVEVSPLTLAVFEDLGYPNVNYDMAFPNFKERLKGMEYAARDCYDCGDDKHWCENEGVCEPKGVCCDGTPNDPCCGSTDPCCGSNDPCCGSTDPCCGSTDPCCGLTDPCCGSMDPECGTRLCPDGQRVANTQPCPPGNPPPGQMTSPDQTGRAYPDPHFNTWNGKFYDYHGECDMILVQNSFVDIHIRTQEMSGWSDITNVALRILGDVIEYNSHGEFYFNHVLEAPATSMGGAYPITRSSQQIEIDLSGGQTIRVSRGYGLSIQVAAHESDFADSQGMWGNWSGAMVGRDGVTVYESNTTEFALHWQVSKDLGDPELFLGSNSLPNAPLCTEPGGAYNPTPEELATAEAACANTADPTLRANCVFDVSLTGDALWAYSTVYEDPLSAVPGRCIAYEYVNAYQGNCQTLGGTCVWRCDSERYTCLSQLCSEVGNITVVGDVRRRLSLVEGCSCALPLPGGFPSSAPSESLPPLQGQSPTNVPTESSFSPYSSAPTGLFDVSRRTGLE